MCVGYGTGHLQPASGMMRSGALRQQEDILQAANGRSENMQFNAELVQDQLYRTVASRLSSGQAVSV